MCESYNFLESSTAFFCVLFTVHLLDILSWENNTFGYSWKSHPSPWLWWYVNEIVRDLHRAKKNNTTEEMMMENFLYGSSDGKLGPIALDFYYALQWMTLLSECGCSSWGASAEENRENRERKRERKRVGREKASLPFCVLCWLAHGTLNFSPPCWYHSSMILSIFNSNVGTGRWVGCEACTGEKHFIIRAKKAAPRLTRQQTRDGYAFSLNDNLKLIGEALEGNREKNTVSFSHFFLLHFTFTFSLLCSSCCYLQLTVYVEVWDSTAPSLYYILCHILLWLRRKRSRVLRATLCLRIQTLAELWNFPTNAHLNSKEKSDELNSFLFFSEMNHKFSNFWTCRQAWLKIDFEHDCAVYA